MQQEAMEDDKNNPKYAKLLAEYSKVHNFSLIARNFLSIVFRQK